MVIGILARLASGIGSKVLAKLALGLAIAGAVLAVLLRAKQAGRAAERVESVKRTLESVEVRHEVEREILRTGGDDARRRLRQQWSRD